MDNQGFETSFRNLVLEMYGRSLQMLPSDHAVYSSYYALDGSDFSYTYPGNGTQWNQEPLEGYTVSITVTIDIKPESCPNPLNLRSKGVLPVAILGTEDIDVNSIDIATVRLEGVAPIRSSYEDVATPVTDGNDCDCNAAGPDGYTDLALKFRTPEIALALLNDTGELTKGEQLVLTLTGTLLDGTPIEGSDCVVLVGQIPESVAATRSDGNKDGEVNLADLFLLKRYFGKSATLDE